MESICVNRFKAYRPFRWLRSSYLWSHENPYLDKYNIKVYPDSSKPCDVMVIPCPHLPGLESPVSRDDWLPIDKTIRGSFDYTDIPIICDSSLDPAYIDPTVYKLLSYPQVRFYLTSVMYREQRLYQRRSWGGDYYGSVYARRYKYEAGPDVRPDRDPFTPEMQAKFRNINRPVSGLFSDSVYEYISQKIKPLKNRSIDLFWGGRTLYDRSNQNFPNLARQDFVKKWPTLPGNKVFLDYSNHEGNLKMGKPVTNFKYPFDYVDKLLDSKVVVSPWGWSPWCLRDIEALACGCIVVKPECSNMLIYPDIYNPANQLMIWCDLFYNHLPNQLHYIYENLDEMQERADRGRKFVVDALYPKDKVYEYWTRDIREMLETCLEKPAYSQNVPSPQNES